MQLDGKWMTHSFWKVPSSGGAWALEHVLDAKIYKPLSPFYFGVEEILAPPYISHETVGQRLPS